MNDTDQANPTETAVETDLAGRRLGDYQLLRRLGRGSMAEVYLAEQHQTLPTWRAATSPFATIRSSIVLTVERAQPRDSWRRSATSRAVARSTSHSTSRRSHAVSLITGWSLATSCSVFLD